MTEFLSFITIWLFEFYHNLGVQVSSQYEYLSFITIWVIEFHHNLSFWVSSRFELLRFITIWVFDFLHNLSFWWKTFLVKFLSFSSQFELFGEKTFFLWFFFYLWKSFSLLSLLSLLWLLSHMLEGRKVLVTIWHSKGHFFTNVTDGPTDQWTDRPTTRLQELLWAAKNHWEMWGFFDLLWQNSEHSKSVLLAAVTFHLIWKPTKKGFMEENKLFLGIQAFI